MSSPLPQFIRDTGTGNIYDTSGGFLDHVTDANDFTARGGSGNNYLDVPNAGQYLNDYFRQQATDTYDPSLQATLAKLNLDRSSIDQNVADTTQNFNNAGKSTLEQQNSLGLLQSGGTSDLIAKNEGDKARSLAALALQRAGIDVQAGAATTQNQLSINDMVSKLLGGSEAARASATQPAQSIDLGDRIALMSKTGKILGYLPKGLTPGAGSASAGNSDMAGLLTALLGGGAGSTPMTQDDVVKELQNEFASGQAAWGGKDQQYIQKIQQALPGVSQQAAATIFYHTRKPFEQGPTIPLGRGNPSLQGSMGGPAVPRPVQAF